MRDFPYWSVQVRTAISWSNGLFWNAYRLLLADVHEVVFVAAENRSATFPASSAGCRIELLTSAPTLAAYAHRAEEHTSVPQEYVIIGIVFAPAGKHWH